MNYRIKKKASPHDMENSTGPTQTFKMECQFEQHLRPLGSVMVIMVADPRRRNEPRFIVGGDDNIDPHFLFSCLQGGQQVLFGIMAHEAGKAKGLAQKQNIIVPPAGLNIPPFPAR